MDPTPRHPGARSHATSQVAGRARVFLAVSVLVLALAGAGPRGAAYAHEPPPREPMAPPGGPVYPPPGGVSLLCRNASGLVDCSTAAALDAAGQNIGNAGGLSIRFSNFLYPWAGVRALYWGPTSVNFGLNGSAVPLVYDPANSALEAGLARWQATVPCPYGYWWNCGSVPARITLQATVPLTIGTYVGLPTNGPVLHVPSTYTATLTAEVWSGSTWTPALPFYNSLGVLTPSMLARTDISFGFWVFDWPITGLAASNDSITQLGGTTTLTASVTGGSNAAFTWAFGDGNSGAGIVVTHTYAASGVYTATVHASNRGSDADAQTVVIVNAPPAAAADSATTAEDTPVAIPVLANDSDADGDTLHVAAVSVPANGTAAISGTTEVLYTPALNYNGGDVFTYTVGDGRGGFATAPVTVTVTPVNDPPVAVADTATTAEDTPVAIPVLANDYDVDGDILHVAAVGLPAHGTTAISGTTEVLYTPALNYNGGDVFTYTVGDGHGGFATAPVTLTVTPVNDPPVVEAGPDQTANEGASVTFSGSYVDPDPPPPGAATILWDFGDGVTTTATLSPTHAYADNGVYTVTLTVLDELGAPGSDTLHVTVLNVAPVVNAGPDQTARVHAVVSFAGSFTDPGTLDTHAFAWDFGDGTVVTGTLVPQHAFAASGIYTVTLTVQDDDGGIGADTLRVTVRPYELMLPVVIRQSGTVRAPGPLDGPRDLARTTLLVIDTLVRLITGVIGD